MDSSNASWSLVATPAGDTAITSPVVDTDIENLGDSVPMETHSRQDSSDSDVAMHHIGCNQFAQRWRRLRNSRNDHASRDERQRRSVPPWTSTWRLFDKSCWTCNSRSRLCRRHRDADWIRQAHPYRHRFPQRRPKLTLRRISTPTRRHQ